MLGAGGVLGLGGAGGTLGAVAEAAGGGGPHRGKGAAWQRSAGAFVPQPRVGLWAQGRGRRRGRRCLLDMPIEMINEVRCSFPDLPVLHKSLYPTARPDLLVLAPTRPPQPMPNDERLP